MTARILKLGYFHKYFLRPLVPWNLFTILKMSLYSL